MKSINYSPLFFAFFFMIVFSCSKPASLNQDLALQHIPAEASTLTVLRLPQLLAKADFDNFQKLPVYQEIIKEAQQNNPALAEIVKDPQQSGIDFKGNIYIFNQMASQGMEKVFTGVVIPLADETAFAAMAAKMNGLEVTRQGKISIGKTPQGPTIAWNHELAIIGTSNRMNTDITTQMVAMLTGEINAIGSDKNLQECLSLNGDIVTWASSNAIAGFKDAQLMVSGAGFDPEAFKDNYLHGYLNFEKGEVLGHSDFIIKKELSKDLDLLFKDKVKTDFSPYIPGTDLGMTFSGALDLKGVNQLLSERPQTKGFINYALKESGLSVDDLAKALGGDFIVAIYNKGEMEQVPGLMATNISDQALFGKFVELAKTQGILTQLEDNLYTFDSRGLDGMIQYGTGSSMMGKERGMMLLAHDMAFFSSDKAMLATIKSGGFKKADQLPKAYAGSINSHIFSLLTNFDNFGEMKNQSPDFPLLKMEINAGRKASDFDLQLKDKTTNSLKTLLWMLNEQYEKGEFHIGTEEGRETI